MQAQKRNIGGSIFSGGGPEVCKPLAFGKRTLQVVASEELDTHFLTITNADGRCILAEHPNGHSLKSLAERMIARDGNKVEEQRLYIERCGGMVRARSDFDGYLEELA